jgi:hypothetical protein
MFVVLAAVVASLAAAVWFLPSLTGKGNPFAHLPSPTRLSGFVHGQPIDEGADRAAAFQAMLAQATTPGQNNCQGLGPVTLHYASGDTKTVGLGCCTVWIDGKSWHLGDNAGEQFFPRPSEPAAR